MKQDYYVTIPIAGAIATVIRARNEEEAIAKAIELGGVFKEIILGPKWELLELDLYEVIAEGNITHSSFNEATADPVEP